MGIELPAGAGVRQVQVVTQETFLQFSWTIQPPPVPGGPPSLVFVIGDRALVFPFDPIAFMHFRNDVARAPGVVAGGNGDAT